MCSVRQVQRVCVHRAVKRAGGDLLRHLPGDLVARRPQSADPAGQLQCAHISRQGEHSQADGGRAGALRHLLCALYQRAALGHVGPTGAYSPLLHR